MISNDEKGGFTKVILDEKSMIPMMARAFLRHQILDEKSDGLPTMARAALTIVR
jgi:hypothetical protein